MKDLRLPFVLSVYFCAWLIKQFKYLSKAYEKI